VFGGSLARHLAGSDWEVTLVDQYPPGHVRAASGGESRLLRCAHGGDRWYTRSARRARELWGEIEDEASSQLLVQAGVVWLARRDDGWEAESERMLRDEGIPAERLDVREARRFFPSLDFEGLQFALYEPEAGVLRARDSTRVLAAQAQARGARFVGGRAKPAGAEVVVGDDRLAADRVVWACGAWLPWLFPDIVRLRVTKQDVYFFGAPIAWQTPPLPAWVDYDAAVYGVGDLDGRGFKVAPDHEGPAFDPDTGTRIASEQGEREARAYLARRFPALSAAPLVGARTCQYALTTDTEFVIAPHPEYDGVWIVGGGSGHGFKHGPALAEYVAGLLEGRAEPDERFRLSPHEAARSLRTAGT
jgi:glycine/D-amino acid oxidase-like deaminating enzyme